MADVHFGVAAVLRAHLFGQRVHFLRQDGDAAAHFVVTHFGDQHLFADLRTVGVVVQPFIRQAAAQLIDAHLVLRGDIGDRFIQIGVGHGDAHFLGHLQLDVIHDQAFDDLMAQRLVVRQLLAGLLGVELH